MLDLDVSGCHLLPEATGWTAHNLPLSVCRRLVRPPTTAFPVTAAPTTKAVGRSQSVWSPHRPLQAPHPTVVLERPPAGLCACLAPCRNGNHDCYPWVGGECLALPAAGRKRANGRKVLREPRPEFRSHTELSLSPYHRLTLSNVAWATVLGRKRRV